MRPLTVIASLGAGLGLAAAVVAQAPSPKAQAAGDWPSYGGTNWSQKSR